MKKIFIVLLVLIPFVTQAGRVNTYKTLAVEGWQILIDEDLIISNPKVEEVGLKNLKESLEKINKILPKAFTSFSRKDGMKIFISPSRKVFNRTGMFFVPKGNSGFETGLERVMSNAIVIIDKSIFMKPDLLLHYLAHEFAHYYHLNVLGYMNKDIWTSYYVAKVMPTYREASFNLSNHLEFFAESSAMFFTMREELSKIDKGAVSLMEKLWGTKPAQYDKILKGIKEWEVGQASTLAREQRRKARQEAR